MYPNPCEKTSPNSVKCFPRLTEPLGRRSRALRAVCKRIFSCPPAYDWIEGNAPHEPRGSHKRCHGDHKRPLHARLPPKQAPNSIDMRPGGAQREGKVANRTVHPSKIKGSQETRMSRPKPPKYLLGSSRETPKTCQYRAGYTKYDPRNRPVASVTYSMAVTE